MELSGEILHGQCNVTLGYCKKTRGYMVYSLERGEGEGGGHESHIHKVPQNNMNF